jgi:hypothetical protein|tara:strand:+ start:1061 stop:1252 length:192 start_codon:yes stop_codon:yes gene_type:complete
VVLDPVEDSVDEDLLSLLDVDFEELSDFDSEELSDLDSEVTSPVVVSDEEVPALFPEELPFLP